MIEEMEIGSVFQFTAPNGADVIGVCVGHICTHGLLETFLCYGQNKLFTWMQARDETNENFIVASWYDKIVVDYAVLPNVDKIMEEWEG